MEHLEAAAIATGVKDEFLRFCTIGKQLAYAGYLSYDALIFVSPLPCLFIFSFSILPLFRVHHSLPSLSLSNHTQLHCEHIQIVGWRGSIQVHKDQAIHRVGQQVLACRNCLQLHLGTLQDPPGPDPSPGCSPWPQAPWRVRKGLFPHRVVRLGQVRVKKERKSHIASHHQPPPMFEICTM